MTGPKYKNILVVDDDENIRFLIEEYFKFPGCMVEIASDGFQALELFKQKYHDIVITDYKMPGMNGIELINKIKSIVPSCIFIAITGNDDAKSIANLKKAGISNLFFKPLNMIEIMEAIKKILQSF